VAGLGTLGSVTLAVLGLKIGFLPVILTGAAMVMGVALVRESLNLGRVLHEVLRAVARRAKLHHLPALRDQPDRAKGAASPAASFRISPPTGRGSRGRSRWRC